MKLIYGPDPIFKEKSEAVSNICKDTEQICDALEALLYTENAVGVAAPMIGVLKRIISYDLRENEIRDPLTMINPEIIWKSEEQQTFEEGSICFPGVVIHVKRPKAIKVRYLNAAGQSLKTEAEGWLATVIQHEIDYLDGKTIFDRLSPLKQKMAFKKTKKYQKEMNFN